MKRINPYKIFRGIFVPNFVLRSKHLSANAKLTYGLLLQFAGKDGSCYPSQKTIAERLGMSERSVRNYITELEASKLIEVDQVGLGKSNRYYFLEWQGISSQDRQASATQQMQNPATPIERDLEKEIHSNNNYVVFVDKWNELFGTSLRMTAKKRTQIKNRLLMFKESEILQALENRANDSWMNTEGKKYRGEWNSFWRNDEKVEHWLGKEPQKQEQRRFRI